jgi:hypothetical protein
VPHRPNNDYPALKCADVMRSGPVGVAACGGLGAWRIPTLSYAGLHDDYMEFVPHQGTSGQPGGMTVTRHLNNPTNWVPLRGGDGYVAIFAFLEPSTTTTVWQYTLLCRLDDTGALTGQLGDVSAPVVDNTAPVGQGTARRFTIYDAVARGGTLAALLEHEEIDATGVTLVANGKRLLDFGAYSSADSGAVPGNSPNFTSYYPMHMALTADGRIVLAGEQRDQRFANGVALRFLLLDTRGTILSDFTGPVGSGPTALAVGKDDEVVALYYDDVPGTGMLPNGHLDRYDLSFKRIASTTPSDLLTWAAMDINAASQLALAGTNNNGVGRAQVLRTSDFGNVGPPILAQTNTTPVSAADLTDDGELLLAGGYNSHIWLMRYDARGAPEWSAPKTAPATDAQPYLAWWDTSRSFVSLETNGNVLVSDIAPLEYCP